MRSATEQSLPPSETILNCVYQQWKKLAVWVDPAAEHPVALRVEGKQRDSTNQAVLRDDVWMAFSIGLQ